MNADEYFRGVDALTKELKRIVRLLEALKPSSKPTKDRSWFKKIFLKLYVNKNKIDHPDWGSDGGY